MIKKIGINFIKLFIFIFLAVSILPYAIIDTQEQKIVDQEIFNNSQFVTINDIELHYRAWEPLEEAKGYILLIHGFGGSTFSWRKNVEFLKEEGFYTIAIDLPGFGFSDRVVLNNGEASKLLNDFTKKIESTVYKNNIDWVLVGHSMGSKVIVNYINNYSNFSKVVFVDGALSERSNNMRFVLKYPPAQEWLKQIVSKIYLTEEKVEEILHTAYGESPEDYEIKGYLNPLLIEGTIENYIRSIQIDNKFNIDFLKEVDKPIYVIWGEEDPITPINIMNDLKENIQGVKTYVVQDAYHCPMETHSEEFNIMLKQILE